MTGSSPVDSSKLGTKRHILTDKQGIPLSAAITSANTHDIKAVADVIDNAVIKRPTTTTTANTFLSTTKQRKTRQHLCLDRAYSSKSIENEIIHRGYVPHIPYKRKRGQKKEEKINQKQYDFVRNKRWVVEKELTLGITDSEICSQDMKRKLRIIWAWCNYHAVS